jgi:hypothetical protein
MVAVLDTGPTVVEVVVLFVVVDVDNVEVVVVDDVEDADQGNIAAVEAFAVMGVDEVMVVELMMNVMVEETVACVEAARLVVVYDVDALRLEASVADVMVDAEDY